MEAQNVADYLIKEGYLLTALELHVELSEKGKPLSSLSSYFKNPSNFEFTRSSPQSSVSGSLIQDEVSSLFDLTRNSEDSYNVSSNAVLEYEIRTLKMQNAKLRQELTENAKTPREIVETDVTQVENTVSDENDGLIKAHEQKILNFLINEYLLQYNFKLTSITFSDENNEADYLDDFDSIGINFQAKPPNLLKLYRDYGKHFKPEKSSQSSQDAQVMTDEDVRISSLKDENDLQMKHVADLESKISDLNVVLNQKSADNDQLKMQVNEKDSIIEILRMHKNDDKSEDLNEVSVTSIDNVANNKADVNSEKVSRFTEFISQQCSPNLDQEEVDVDLNKNIIDEVSICLPKVVPNILINKREELLPLLLATITQNSSPKSRDELLNLLFNLIKRPD